MAADARTRRLLILCKTYPSPSAKHVETSCVAAADEAGNLVRLYPVPFRLVAEPQQFRKWQWITARVRRATGDERPESHSISVDTISLDGPPIGVADDWAARRHALRNVRVYGSFNELERDRVNRGVSLGLVRPTSLEALHISQSRSEWTKEELEKLLQAQRQMTLFDSDSERRSLATLRKLPIDLHYEYACTDESGTTLHRHKLVDWEAGALFWNVHRDANWERKLRARLFDGMRASDLHLLMGTIHRFPGQWLIVSILYLPKPPADAPHQEQMFPA